MIQIRRNTFETNSSSTHSITICSEDTYNDWVNGKCRWIRWASKGKEFINEEDIISYLESQYNVNRAELEYMRDTDSEKFDSYLEEWDLYSFERYQYIEHEDYVERHTTPSGDNIVAFGYYGYDV